MVAVGMISLPFTSTLFSVQRVTRAPVRTAMPSTLKRRSACAFRRGAMVLQDFRRGFEQQQAHLGGSDPAIAPRDVAKQQVAQLGDQFHAGVASANDREREQRLARRSVGGMVGVLAQVEHPLAQYDRVLERFEIPGVLRSARRAVIIAAAAERNHQHVVIERALTQRDAARGGIDGRTVSRRKVNRLLPRMSRMACTMCRGLILLEAICGKRGVNSRKFSSLTSTISASRPRRFSSSTVACTPPNPPPEYDDALAHKPL